MKKTILAAAAAVVLAGAPVGAQDFEPNPDFMAVQKHLDPGGSFYVYLDSDDFFETLGSELAPLCEVLNQSAPLDNQQNGELIIKFLKDGYPKMGLGSIAGFGMSGRTDAATGLSINRSFLHLKGERIGLLAPTNEPAHTPRLLHFAPTETMIYTTATTYPGKWVKAIRQAASAVEPQSGEAMVNMGLAMMDIQARMPLQRILEAVNGEMTIAVAPRPGVTVTIPLDDSSKTLTLARPDIYATVEIGDGVLYDALTTRLKGEGFTVKTVESDGINFTHVLLPNICPDCEMSYTADGKDFFVSSTSPAMLAAAVARHRAGTGGLSESEEYKTLTAGLPTEVNSMIFVSSQVMETLNAALAETANNESDQAILEKMTGFIGTLYGLHQRVAITRNTDEGIEWVSREKRDSRSMLAALGALPMGMAGAIAVPSFLRARDISGRNACQENLAKIDGAKQQWALENNAAADAQPTWEDLVGEQAYIRRTPMCPGGGTYTIGDIATEPSCSLSSTGSSPEMYHTFPQAEY
ncbi:hypothetical protein GC173_01890 [bacterium]|nr:hypothetical protein [bacterium]